MINAVRIKRGRDIVAKASDKNHNFPTVADLIANATDFLTSATDDLKKRPKHSVIAFYTAVELILKARLMAEHWTLVVSKNADRASFTTGDFASVTFDQACTRLQNVIGTPLSEDARKVFNSLRKHRNKMVHFYHDGETDEAALEVIALEQLLGWRALVALIEGPWQATFVNMIFDITALDERFKEHRLYAKAKFESLAAKLKEIEEKGGVIVECHSCGFLAAERIEEDEGIYSSRCLVCSSYQNWMVAPCPKCGTDFTNYGDDGADCDACKTRLSVEELVDALNEQVATKDNYFDVETPANCSSCDGYHTVIEWKGAYVCLNCIYITEDLMRCDWCGDANNGDLEMSSIYGCNHCDGNAKLLGDD